MSKDNPVVSIEAAASFSLSAEERATMFIEWCALKGFGLQGWPEDAHAQLAAHINAAVDDVVNPKLSPGELAESEAGGGARGASLGRSA